MLHKLGRHVQSSPGSCKSVGRAPVRQPARPGLSGAGRALSHYQVRSSKLHSPVSAFARSLIERNSYMTHKRARCNWYGPTRCVVARTVVHRRPTAADIRHPRGASIVSSVPTEGLQLWARIPHILLRKRVRALRRIGFRDWAATLKCNRHLGPVSEPCGGSNVARATRQSHSKPFVSVLEVCYSTDATSKYRI